MITITRSTATPLCHIAPLLCALLGVSSQATANEIYESLVARGIDVGREERVELPRPILEDGGQQPAQRQAIESLIAGRYDWDTFSRRSVVSPFLLKISDSDAASGQIGRRVDLYFIAYGSLDALAQDDYLNQQLDLAASNESSDGQRVKTLSSDDLDKRGLSAGRQAEDSRWLAVTSTLLGKVRIQLTTQNIKSRGNGSVLIASIADRRFEGDREYPNSWQSITIDDAGRRQLGPLHPYSGLGSYVKATQLADPPGAIFIEYHVAFAEPSGWFHGANLLRSKLPIVVQDLVRKFRRSLSERN